MSRATDDVKNWMHMFRWIVKLIRDDYGIDEKALVRDARLDGEIGLSLEQVEHVIDDIAESFSVRFPPGALDEIVKLEELCMLSAWLKGLYKQPEFLSADYVAAARSMNAVAA